MRNVLLKAVSLALLLGIAPPAWSVPAPPFPIRLHNGDGPPVEGYLRGDEHLSWAEDLEGFALVRDPADGRLHYATLGRDGALEPTGYLAGVHDPRAVGLTPGLRPSRELMRRVMEQKRRLAPPQPPPTWQGNVPNLVLLVRFANQSSHFTRGSFEPVFNGASGSVKAYYGETTYGSWNMISTIVDWIPLSQNDSYYAYNAENLYGHPQDMILEAIQHLDAENFDFTPFDSNNDGLLDAVDVIHSGFGYEYSGNQSHIHSHYADLRWTGSDFYTHDGIHVVGYHTEPEYRADYSQITQIGVIVHETAHFFGLPDLYDYNQASAGLGLWCLLAAGPWAGPNMDGTVPTHLSIWGKAKLGLVSPQHITATAPGQILHPVETNREALRLDSGMPASQYFLLEDRQRTGFDQYLPGAGLLIFHVDESRSDNNNPDRYLVDLEQADGRRDLNNNNYALGDTQDPYPTSNNTSFTPTSNPNSKAYGAATSKISVTNIARSGSNITFDVTIEGTTGSTLQASPASLIFSGTEGGADPATQALQISHQGATALSFSASGQDAWVRVNPGSGTTPAGLRVSVSLSGLTAGSHLSAVRITAAGATNSPLNIPVQLQVQEAPPALAVNPAQMSFVTDVGLDAAPQVLRITNRGGGRLDWSVSQGGAWFTLSAGSGTAPSDLTVSPQTTTRAPGDYTGSITVVAGLQSVVVPMTLQVRDVAPPAPILVSPANHSDQPTRNPELILQNVIAPAGGAVTYDFEIFEEGSATALLSFPGVSQGTGAVTLITVEPPLQEVFSYQWRARATDAYGLAGPWSETWQFNVNASSGGGCGCGLAGGAGPVWLAGLLALLLRRRRS